MAGEGPEGSPPAERLPRGRQVRGAVPGGEDAPWRPRGRGARSSRAGGAEPVADPDGGPRPGDGWGLPAAAGALIAALPGGRGWWNEARSRQKTKSAGHLAGSE